MLGKELKRTEMVEFDHDRVEQIVGKEENAGFHNFITFASCF